MPPKKSRNVADPPSFKGEFSFVNKDATNIDSKDHNAHVSWHVVNRYERWKKNEQTKRLRESVDISTRSGPSNIAATAESVRKKRSSRRNSLLTTSPQPSDENALFAYPPSPWAIENAEQSMIALSNSQLHQGQDASFDAFAPIQFPRASTDEGILYAINDITAYVKPAQYPPLIAQILQYTASTIIPAMWPNDAPRFKWAYEISRTIDEVTSIGSDPCYTSASLCLFATIMASATGSADIASQACFFQTQAMAELRQRVGPHLTGHDLSTLKAILRLFSAETALDNTSTARVHLKMLRNIVTHEGGVIVIDSWFRENLLAADCYFALKYQTRPLFPVSEWTPGTLNQSWKTRLATARFIGDHPPEVDEVLDSALKSIIIDLRELFRVDRYLLSHTIPSDDQLLRWRQLRKLDCLNRLADHQLSLKIYPHLYERSELQLAVCAAIALLTAMVLGNPEPVRFGIRLIHELRSRIEAANINLSNNNDNLDTADPKFLKLVFWMLYVGRMGEETHPVLEADEWFAGEVEKAAAELDLESLEDQHTLAKHFLHSQSLVDEIHEGRSKRMICSLDGLYESCGTSWRLPEPRTGVELDV